LVVSKFLQKSFWTLLLFLFTITWVYIIRVNVSKFMPTEHVPPRKQINKLKSERIGATKSMLSKGAEWGTDSAGNRMLMVDQETIGTIEAEHKKAEVSVQKLESQEFRKAYDVLRNEVESFYSDPGTKDVLETLRNPASGSEIMHRYGQISQEARDKFVEARKLFYSFTDKITQFVSVFGLGKDFSWGSKDLDANFGYSPNTQLIHEVGRIKSLNPNSLMELIDNAKEKRVARLNKQLGK